MINAIIGRYAEIFLKRSRRAYFLNALRRNIRVALGRTPEVRITTPYGRLMVTLAPLPDGTLPPLGPEAARIEDTLSRMFGLVSFSRAIVTPNDLETLKQVAIDMFRQSVERRGIPSTFRVRTTRADKSYPIRSDALNRLVAGALFLQWPDLKVSLNDAALEVGIEIRPEMTFVHVESTPGPGGLPVGSNGRAILLLSGGIDSPVAGWCTMKRGVTIDAVYFHSFPYTSDQAREKVVELARSIATWQGDLRLTVVPFAKFQEACRDNAPAPSLVLLYRRQMVRIAEMIARERGASALVTGESIGQVASQTLPNIACIDAVATMPIIRPLITNDKNETIALARRLGTYDISVQPFDDCCSLFVARHPELGGDPRNISRMEEQLPIEELLQDALEGATVIRVGSRASADR